MTIRGRRGDHVDRHSADARGDSDRDLGRHGDVVPVDVKRDGQVVEHILKVDADERRYAAAGAGASAAAGVTAGTGAAIGRSGSSGADFAGGALGGGLRGLACCGWPWGQGPAPPGRWKGGQIN